MAQQKTNVMRILDKAKVDYTAFHYESNDGLIDGVSVAAKIGMPPEAVFKTLVTGGKSGGYYVFVIPASGELDLKKAAAASGEKAVAMLHVSDINKVTGYIRGGCSPIGMKKPYPTFIDSSALSQERIVVSAGKIGSQVCLAPQALAETVGAKIVPLIAE